jgi:hypothetical protein
MKRKKLCILVKTEHLRQPNLKITKLEFNIPLSAKVANVLTLQERLTSNSDQ